MTFAHPFLLLLLLLIPLLLWGAYAWQQRMTRRLTHFSRHASRQSTRAPLQWTLLALAFASLILALAGPRWGRSEEEVLVRSRTLMVAVDVSRSMLAKDIYPSRLERAKADLVDLLDVCRGDRVGLLAFRGRANVLCPLTTDTAFLRTTVDALSIHSAPPGETHLADAIRRSLDAFEEETTAHCAILLITDGEDLDGDALALAKEAGERKIPIFTVGIGSEAGATIPDGAGVVTYEDTPVITRLKPETLRAIADASGGQYIPLATAERARTTLRAIYTRYLAQLADKETREHFELRLTDRTSLFVLVAVILLLVAGATSPGRLGRMRRKATLLLALGLPMVLAAATPRDAQHAYDDGNFAEAARLYGEVMPSADPAKQPLYAYNGALAHWKAGELEAALTALAPALEDKTFAVRAHALAGILQMALDSKEADLAKRIQRRTDAVAHFAEVLRLEPTDEARRNLARARDGLEDLRFAHRKATALERLKETPLPQLLPEMLARQRTLLTQAEATFAQTQPRVRLAQFETLSRDMTEQADRWFAVQAALPELVAQIEDEAVRNELLALSEAEQRRLDQAAAATLLHRADATPLIEGEPPLYRLWKLVADPPGLIDEAITVQTHEVEKGTPCHPDRTNLADVYALLKHFKQRFPEWAQAQLQAAAQPAPKEGETPPPPAFTEEDVRIINAATEATLPLLATVTAPQHKDAVLENLKLIREHLPRQSQNNASQQQQDPSASPQSQPQSSAGNEEQQSQPPPPTEGEQAQDEQQPEPKEPTDEEKELEALLQRAVDREREHNEEKQRYLRPLRPTARDW